MFKRAITPTLTPARLSCLWLALAAALSLGTSVQWVIPLAAWLAPLFLLRFVRLQRPLPGFLVAWLARVAVAVVVLRGILLYPGIAYYPLVVLLTGLAVVLLGGGARLALFPPQANQVRIAGLSASQAAVALFNRKLPQATLNLLVSGKAAHDDCAIARSAFAIINNDLLARSQQEAAAGAKIVVWPEASPVSASILQEDEPALFQRAGALARQADMYLDVYLPGAEKGPFVRDEAVLLDPMGNVAWNYEKTHPAPGNKVLS